MFAQCDMAAVEAQCTQAWGSGNCQDRRTEEIKKEISTTPAVASSDSMTSHFEALKVEAFLSQNTSTVCKVTVFVFICGG